MKVFKSPTHSYSFLTKFRISQSVFDQFTWSLAVFEGVIRGYERPVSTGLNQSIWTSLLFLKSEKTGLQSGLFSSPVRSSSGLFPVLRPDLKALDTMILHS